MENFLPAYFLRQGPGFAARDALCRPSDDDASIPRYLMDNSKESSGMNRRGERRGDENSSPISTWRAERKRSWWLGLTMTQDPVDS